MIKMLALICIVGGPTSACTYERAVAIVVGPTYESAAVCAVHSQAFEKDAEVEHHAVRHGRAVLRLWDLPDQGVRFSLNIFCKSRAVA